MADFELLTAASPTLLRDRLARDLAETMAVGGSCIVTPRRHFRRDLIARILPRASTPGLFVPRVITVQELITHFVKQCPNLTVLTRLQVRQIIARLILEMEAEFPGCHFPGQIIGGRVSGATLSAMARLFAELEPYRDELPPDDLERKLGERAGGAQVSARAASVALLYRRYLATVEGQKSERGETIVGPLGRAIHGCTQAARGAVPEGLTTFLFVGLDGVGPRDISLLLIDGLRHNPAVGAVRAAIVLPEHPADSAWPHHGNDGLLQFLGRARGGEASASLTRVLLRPEPGTDDAPTLAPELAAVAADPFAYRLDAVPAGPAVRGVRVPDTQLEVNWVAGDIKRALLEDRGLRCEDVAVVIRDVQQRAQDMERALTDLGVPAVSSRQAPVSSVPGVRAILALYRVAAFGWKVADVVAVAESPYLPFDLNPTLVARVGAMGTEPGSPTEWMRRIERAVAVAVDASDPASRRADTLPENAVLEAEHLARRFPLFVDFVRTVLPDLAPQSASDWVASLVRIQDRCNVHSHILSPGAHAPRAQRAMLARQDIDGLNALWHAANDWLRGREIAARGHAARGVGTANVPDAPMSATEWLVEVEAMADQTSVRMTSFYESAVQLVDPSQAALRRWRKVYIIGLADGLFPQRAREDEFGLTDVERQALALPTADERAARERLLFHLAAATATETLTLVTPAADDRGKSLVASPFLIGLRLRLRGFEIASVTATSMVPQDIDGVLCRDDVDLLAIRQIRATVSAAHTAGADVTAAMTAAVGRDLRMLAPWVAQTADAAVVEGWGREAHRMGLDELQRRSPATAADNDYRAFVGQLRPDEVPARVTAVETAFSPSELGVYESCHFRWFATRVLGLRAAGDSEEEHDEAAAFGTLQHEVLEHLYQDLDERNLLPPKSEADIDAAVARIDALAPQYVEKHAASAHPTLWQQDLAFVTDVLRAFVRRDLTRMYDLERGGAIPEPRTKLVSLETRAGTLGRPLEFTVNDVTFRLRGQFDRVEEIDDVRLPDELQGALIVRDYKGTRRTPDEWQLLRAWMEGKSLQLPLYGAMAEQHFGRPVFGVSVLNTSLPTDPAMLQTQAMTLDDAGRVSLGPVMHGRNPVGNALGIAVEAATTKAAELIQSARAGEYAPQPGRSCFGCHLNAICRASTETDPAKARRRAQMPLVVDAAALPGVRPVRAEPTV